MFDCFRVSSSESFQRRSGRPTFLVPVVMKDGYIRRVMLTTELPGNRKRGKPKRRFMDVAREDMAVAEVMEQDADDRIKLRCKILCSDP